MNAFLRDAYAYAERKSSYVAAATLYHPERNKGSVGKRGRRVLRQSCVDSSAALRMTVKLEDIPQRSWLIPATTTVGSLS